MDLRALRERPVIATSMIPFLIKDIDSWTYVLYRKICNCHLYDSVLLYVFWLMDLRALQERTVIATSMIPYYPAGKQ